MVPPFFHAGGGRTSGYNPRRRSSTARNAILQYVRNRAASGEPCAICGQPIDVHAPQWYVDPRDGKRKRAPWSCECDEIVPVSRWFEGGYPSPEACALDRNNVQPVHRICNQRRGNKRGGGVKPSGKALRTIEGNTSRDWFAE